MGGKPVVVPSGVEIRGKTVRIRFTWNGQRRSETLANQPTAKGIAAAEHLRTRVIELIKLGAMTDDRYTEMFPMSSYSLDRKTPTLGEFAQVWLDSRDIVKGTRDNYLTVFNQFWMPKLARMRIDEVRPTDIRKIVAETEWSSAGVRRNAMDKLSSVMRAALGDGLIARNPCHAVPRSRVGKRAVDPFEREEAERIIADLYETMTEATVVYACYFEFAFFTGMRPCEIAAMKWSEINEEKRTAHVCRVRVKGEIYERVKTKEERTVLLNDRALHAIQLMRPLAEHRSEFVFPPAGQRGGYIASDSTTKKYLLASLKRLGIRRRRQYDCRHTYATMCLMSGINPAFIANQLGHSVQMLLSTYAKWLNSTSDWTELRKLEMPVNGTGLARDDN